MEHIVLSRHLNKDLSANKTFYKTQHYANLGETPDWFQPSTNGFLSLTLKGRLVSSYEISAMQEEDHVLQGDVNLPSKWAESSQKEFNVRKFNRLCISNMRFFISLLQYMNGQLVDEVTSHDLKIILIVSPAKQTKPWVLQGAL